MAKARGLLSAIPKTAVAKTKKTADKKRSARRAAPAVDPYSDPAGIAAKQAEENRRTAEANFKLNNRASETNAFGSRETRLNEDGTTSETINLSPEQQRQLDLQNQREERLGGIANAKLGEVGDTYGQKYDLSGLKNDPNNLDFSAERARIEGEVYNRYKQDLDTQYAQEQQDFARRMAAEGIPEGSERYNRAQQQMAQNQARGYQDARTQATQISGDEMTRSFGMAMDSRGRAVDEYNMQRDRPYSELSNVLSGMNGPQLPQFQQRAGTNQEAVDVAGLGQAQMGLNEAARQRAFDAREQEKNRQAQYRVAGMSRGGGGGGFDEAAYRAQGAVDNELYDQRLAIQNKYKQTPKQPNSLVQAGSGLLSGIGAGIGNYLGGRFGK